MRFARDLHRGFQIKSDRQEANDMDDRCYFCRRTLNECREYIESLRQDFLKDPSDRYWTQDEKDGSKDQFEKITEYGMGLIDFGSIRTSKGVVHILRVPVCPICKGSFDIIVNNLEFDIDSLREELDPSD